MGALAKVVYGVILSKRSVEKLKKITEDEEIWDEVWPEGTIEYAMTVSNSKEEIVLECAFYNEYSNWWAVVVNDSQIVATEGRIKSFEKLKDMSKYHDVIKTFCKKHTLSVQGKPAWLLVCSKG